MLRRQRQIRSAIQQGVDAGLFADIFSRHWQHLAQNQRQDLAASADATLAAAGRSMPADPRADFESSLAETRSQEMRRSDRLEPTQSERTRSDDASTTPTQEIGRAHV